MSINPLWVENTCTQANLRGVSSQGFVMGICEHAWFITWVDMLEQTKHSQHVQPQANTHASRCTKSSLSISKCYLLHAFHPIKSDHGFVSCITVLLCTFAWSHV